MKTKNGFTLIELMVVFVIIIILAGLVMNLVTAAMNKANKATTNAKLQMVAQALEEFRAIHGRYPPVPFYDGEGQHFSYEFAEHDGRPTAASSPVKAMYPQLVEDVIQKNGEGFVLFRFGLMGFLCPRYMNAANASPAKFVGHDGVGAAGQYSGNTYNPTATVTEWNQYNFRNAGLVDSAQDLEAARRILPFLGATLNPDGSIRNRGIIEYIGWPTGPEHPIPGATGLNNTYRNSVITIWDAWQRDLRYESKPPYDSYKLWSVGPDGISGTLDDLVISQD